jgi:hypothetical protein
MQQNQLNWQVSEGYNADSEATNGNVTVGYQHCGAGNTDVMRGIAVFAAVHRVVSRNRLRRFTIAERPTATLPSATRARMPMCPPVTATTTTAVVWTIAAFRHLPVELVLLHCGAGNTDVMRGIAVFAAVHRVDADVSAGYSYDDYSRRLNYSLRGGMVVHSGGITPAL